MYFSQLTCWVCVVCIAKSFLFSIQLIIPRILEIIAEFVLSPLKGNGNLKLIFIMVIIPLCLNATQVIILV